MPGAARLVGFCNFVDTEEAVAEQRGVARDAAHSGDTELATRLFAERHRPAFDLYIGEVDPKAGLTPCSATTTSTNQRW